MSTLEVANHHSSVEVEALSHMGMRLRNHTFLGEEHMALEEADVEEIAYSLLHMLQLLQLHHHMVCCSL